MAKNLKVSIKSNDWEIYFQDTQPGHPLLRHSGQVCCLNETSILDLAAKMLARGTSSNPVDGSDGRA